MPHRRAVLPFKSLFHKNLDGGGRAASFLFIFAFLILLLTPLNSLYSQTLQQNPNSILFSPTLNYYVRDAPITVFFANSDRGIPIWT
jgi:hypothetical protein